MLVCVQVGPKTWAQFWGGHQRFFRGMLLSAKVPEVARMAAQAIAENMCVLTGLYSRPV
jgi:hypothetical protein